MKKEIQRPQIRGIEYLNEEQTHNGKNNTIQENKTFTFNETNSSKNFVQVTSQ